MSRTPLFHLLRRHVHYARIVDVTGLSAAELCERAAAARWEGAAPAPTPADSRGVAAWSRRRFLGSSAGAVGALALGGCARAVQRVGADEPVLVVGAGIAGLTAAYRLHEAGLAVRVFEAQTRVGGRMYSLRNHFADGQVVELGGELMDTGHTTVRRLAEELDVVLDDVSIEPAGIAHETWHFGGAARSTAEIVEALRPLAARMAADRRRMGEGEITHRTGGAARTLDRLSVAEWLDGAGLSGWIRSLVEVAYTAEYGLEPAQQSSLNLLTMLSVDPFEIFGESDERFRAHEGNDLIPLRLAERLGDRIETGTVLEAVRQQSGRYVLTLRRDGSTIEVASPHVVLALPFTMLRRVRLQLGLPQAQQRAIDELDYGTNAKLMIGFSERIWRARYSANGSTFSDLSYQTTWETSRGQAGRAGVLTNFTGGRNGAQLGQGTASQQAERTVQGLERVFPGIGGLRAGMVEARFHWPSHAWSQGSYACFSPGQWTSFRGLIGRAAGGVHIVGEHASLNAQGFMEGGCETGQAAAAAILRRVGVRTANAVTRRAVLFGGRAAAP